VKSVDPCLYSAWLQRLELKCDEPLSISTCASTPSYRDGAELHLSMMCMGGALQLQTHVESAWLPRFKHKNTRQLLSNFALNPTS
jgi:hypothetical protein